MDVFSAAGAIVFETLGVVAQVQRPSSSSTSIRLVVRDGVERLGEFQQVIGRARHVVARNADWVFRRGDLVAIEGRLQPVEAIIRDDGLVNEVVLHG